MKTIFALTLTLLISSPVFANERPSPCDAALSLTAQADRTLILIWERIELAGFLKYELAQPMGEISRLSRELTELRARLQILPLDAKLPALVQDKIKEIAKATALKASSYSRPYYMDLPRNGIRARETLPFDEPWNY